MIITKPLRQTKEILPTFLFLMLLLGIALVSVLAPSMAHAANGAVESASQITSLNGQVSAVAKDTDYSLGLLKQIFGDMSLAGTADTPLGNAMSKYNAGVMLLGAAVFLFTALMFPIKSAEDGELFGRWNKVFVPFRMVVATLLLFPAASGFSFGQVATYWMVNQSVGLANVVSGAMVEGFTDKAGSSLISQSASSGPIQQLATQIFLAEVCVAAIKDREGNAGYDIRMGQLADGSFEWGPRIKGSGLSGDYCGSLTMIKQDRATATGIGATDVVTGIFNGDNSERDRVTAAANAYQLDMIKDMDAALKSSAEGLVASLSASDSGMSIDEGTRAAAIGETTPAKIAQVALNQTTAATEKFNQLLSSSVNNLSDYGTDMQKQVIDKGWIATGGWMYQIAALQGYYTSLFNEFPKMTEGAFYSGTAKTNQVDAELIAYAKNVADPKAISSLAGDMAGNSYFDSAAGRGTSVSRAFAQKIGFDPNSKNHPLVQLQNGGNVLMATGTAILAVRAIVDSAMEKDGELSVSTKLAITAKTTPFVAAFLIPIIEAAADLLPTIAFILLAAGIVMSIVLPLLPMIHWLGGVLGWFISVFVLILATPVWVASHMFPEGHEIAGRGGPGYMLLLQALLTPVLMVFGFLGGFLICYPILLLVNSMFFFVIDSIDASNISGVFTFLVSVIVYVGFCYYAVSRCFDLIQIVPDKALAAIGGRGDGHEDHHGNKAAIMGYVTRGTSNLTRNLGQGAREQRLRASADLKSKQGNPKA